MSNTDSAGTIEDAVARAFQESERSGEDRTEEGKSKLKSLSDISISDLPPLPTPRQTKRRERNGGITVVLILIFVFVGTTHGILLEVSGGFEHHGTQWWVFFILIYSQAALALLGLLAMLITDPGVIPRSQKTCFPVPADMAPALNDYFEQRGGSGAKQFFPPSGNYLMAEDGSEDSYCVRCLVWRRSKDGKHYHCNTCQRCVKQYDHHCSVFGRCIAGTMWSLKGNFKFFVMMCFLFVTAFFTTFVAVCWSLSNLYGPGWVVPLAFITILYLVVSTRLLAMGPQRLCRACRRR
ncbi:MAG: hypothetical protein SGBAC_008453 [Bacillariaceae sp.]